MGRHTKLQPPARPAGERPRSEKLLEEYLAYLEKTYEIEIQLGEQLDRLTRVQSSIEETLDAGMATPAMVRESAALSRSLVAISAELRQRRSQQSKYGEQMSKDEALAMLLEWVVVMPPHHREKLAERLAELKETDTGRKVLG